MKHSKDLRPDDVIELLSERGHSEYGGEAVTQIEHALQTAQLAEEAQASPELIVAALLHDIGHLLHDLPDDAPDHAIDDRHEISSGNFLSRLFPKPVTEPVRLHVAAKRYLCAVEPEYLAQLSEPSRVSLSLQGGPMSREEVKAFEANPLSESAVMLRRWDDRAKVPQLPTPSLDHFAVLLRQVALK